MSKLLRLISLMINCFPGVRAFRRRKKIKCRKLKIRSRLKNDEPQHLRRYVVRSGVIRRL